MARMRIKICGITSPEDAALAAEAGADAIGLIFTDSPREVTTEQARTIIGALPPWVTPVGVFVNRDPAEVVEIARNIGLGAIQFHGDELPCTVKDLVRQFKVIKAFRIGSEADLADARDYLGACRPDGCLIDARVEGKYGGSGQTAPWHLLAGVSDEFRPLILSGGLTLENVAEAIRVVGPWGVEASSGVESSPGKKDSQKVRDFVRNALSVNP